MITSDTSSPKWENYYLRLREKLLGRDLPIAADGYDFPPPSAKTLKQHGALVALLNLPEFGIFFEFMRDENEREDAKLKASSATEAQLRANHAERAYLEKMASAVVDFVAEVDRNSLARAKWLEEQQKSGQTQAASGFAPPPPMPAL